MVVGIGEVMLFLVVMLLIVDLYFGLKWMFIVLIF